MQVEIVVHVWAVHCKQYGTLFGNQLRSLCDFPPKCDTRLSVVCWEGDRETLFWLDGVEDWLPDHVKVVPVLLPRGEVLNRAIGRNRLALATEADVCWMVDCDYLWGPGCIDSLEQIIGRPEPLFFPRETLISKDHATGDSYITACPMHELRPADFVPKRENRAIGGIQILAGDAARKHGYCNQPKYQQPAEPDVDTIVGFSADAVLRRQLGTAGTAITVPHLYRLRHSVTGDGRAIAAGIPQPSA